MLRARNGEAAPWWSRKLLGKNIRRTNAKVGKKIVPIPLAEAEQFNATIKKLGSNYYLLAANGADFMRKLSAWIDTGHLEQNHEDPIHARSFKRQS